MNQILKNDLETIEEVNIANFPSSIHYYKKSKLILLISLFVIFLCIILYLFLRYHSYKNEKISESLINNFSIHTLYSDTSNYIAKKTQNNVEPFVIGLLKIDKINLMYPILSNSSEELLTISPCRFYGPMPNEVGNLCIAGHNYANKKHFGKLSILDIGDTFQIYDLSGNFLDYIIYDKLEVSADDTSCINQNTNNKKLVTLVTCNNLKGSRLIIKAKENR